MPYARVDVSCQYAYHSNNNARYSSGIPTIKSRFGSVPSDYSMDDVACDGTENSLLDCGYKKQDNCGRGEGAGVICEGTIYLPLLDI